MQSFGTLHLNNVALIQNHKNMLQRLQTVFLLIVVAAMSSFISLSIWEKSSATLQQKVVLNAFHLTHTQDTKVVAQQGNIYIAIIAGVAILLAVFSITQFKNRVLQMTLGAINSAVIATALGLSFYTIFKVGIPMFEPAEQGAYGFGFYATVLALIANMIANRLIRRDEMLVRAADRMR